MLSALGCTDIAMVFVLLSMKIDSTKSSEDLLFGVIKNLVSTMVQICSWSLNIPRLFGNRNWNSLQRLSYSFETLRYFWRKTVTFYDPKEYKMYVQSWMVMRVMYCWNFSFMVPWVLLFTSCVQCVKYMQWYSWQALFSQMWAILSSVGVSALISWVVCLLRVITFVPKLINICCSCYCNCMT